MGIRINKKIGYYLNKKQIKELLVKNYEQILDDLDSEDSKEKAFFKELFQLKNTLGDNSFLSQLEINDIQELYKKKKISAYELIGQVFFYDDFKGILVQTPELIKSNHFDDLIDYYENDMTNKIDFLNRSIYPLGGYRYQGGLDLDDFYIQNPKEITGMVALRALGQSSMEGKKAFKAIVKGGHFTPIIDPLVFIILKAANMLKSDVSKEQLERVIQPVITTTWG